MGMGRDLQFIIFFFFNDHFKYRKRGDAKL